MSPPWTCPKFVSASFPSHITSLIIVRIFVTCELSSFAGEFPWLGGDSQGRHGSSLIHGSPILPGVSISLPSPLSLVFCSRVVYTPCLPVCSWVSCVHSDLLFTCATSHQGNSDIHVVGCCGQISVSTVPSGSLFLVSCFSWCFPISLVAFSQTSLLVLCQVLTWDLFSLLSTPALVVTSSWYLALSTISMQIASKFIISAYSLLILRHLYVIGYSIALLPLKPVKLKSWSTST